MSKQEFIRRRSFALVGAGDACVGKGNAMENGESHCRSSKKEPIAMDAVSRKLRRKMTPLLRQGGSEALCGADSLTENQSKDGRGDADEGIVGCLRAEVAFQIRIFAARSALGPQCRKAVFWESGSSHAQV
jgi:hypothetical protein